MAESGDKPQLVELGTESPVWDRFYSIAPLVLIGTSDADGSLDLAPKHMVTPMGWKNFFGFVCSDAHATCSNIDRSGVFTVSYPKPSQVLFSSLAATPRQRQGDKPIIDYVPTLPAKVIDGAFFKDSYLFFECRHFKTIDGFGDNCLITGEIIAAYAEPGFLRSSEVDDQTLVHDAPLLAFLPPDRFATVERSNAFPFPAHMRK